MKYTTCIHPWKLTWNLKISLWKRRNIDKPPIFGFHVSFWGCTWNRSKICIKASQIPLPADLSPGPGPSLESNQQKSTQTMCKKTSSMKQKQQKKKQSTLKHPLNILPKKKNEIPLEHQAKVLAQWTFLGSSGEDYPLFAESQHSLPTCLRYNNIWEDVSRQQGGITHRIHGTNGIFTYTWMVDFLW